MAWLSVWKYRKSITLSRSSGAVANYQMKLLVGESSGATGEDVDCGGRCKIDFSDLRFTTSDGTTLLDYWIDTGATIGATPNQLATVWIEFDSIGTSATTFYMYYGNASASAVSNGANTFIVYDDFERGNDGDLVGGSWTPILAAAQVVGKISTTYSYGSTRSCKMFKYDGTKQTAMKIPVTASANIAYQFRIRKDNNGSADTTHGDSASYSYPKYENDEKIYYYNNSVFVDTGSSLSYDTWHLFELYKYDYSADTFSMSVNDVEIINAQTQRTNDPSGAAGNANYVYMSERTNNAAAGYAWYFDNFIVRNWRAIGPAWGSWGIRERLKSPFASFFG